MLARRQVDKDVRIFMPDWYPYEDMSRQQMYAATHGDFHENVQRQVGVVNAEGVHWIAFFIDLTTDPASCVMFDPHQRASRYTDLESALKRRPLVCIVVYFLESILCGHKWTDSCYQWEQYYRQHRRRQGVELRLIRPHRRRATWVHGTDLRWKREKEFWNGHGYIVDPTAQRASGYLTNGYGSRVDNEAWEIYDNSKYDYGVNGTLNFVQATFLTKRYDSLGAFITKNQELVDSKTDPNCRLTVYKDSTRSKLPASKLSPTGFTHMRSGATTLATLVARRPASRAQTTPARTIVSGTMRSCATRCARWRNTLPGCATSTW
ncbi:hypothetical protein PF010_g18097 [Phytophthora fragariae]|uniref:Ubiquitin-like protease family profile domain-containing protein n=1 Tax=Phytophthora fragariae TaxID=53985 RepID=A0A6G0KLS5_9STRA|nr:hypothetical protein PF010_g18097 [Phytophthora fragariae]